MINNLYATFSPPIPIEFKPFPYSNEISLSGISAKHSTKGSVIIKIILIAIDNTKFLFSATLFDVMLGKITLAIAKENIVGKLTKLDTAPLSNPYKKTEVDCVKLIFNKFTTSILSIKVAIGIMMLVRVIGKISFNKFFISRLDGFSSSLLLFL